MPGDVRLVHHYVFFLLLVVLPISGLRPARRRGPSALQAYVASMFLQAPAP